jgi:UDP-N-acetyl-D-mannosaminuronic acid dehydrogenase
VACDPTQVEQSRFVVVVIGTPVDEHLNPTFHVMRRFFAGLIPHLRDGHCVVLRSTLYPGTTARVRDLLAAAGKNVSVAYCPERIAEGNAMEELIVLPQIVSGCGERAIAMADELFGRIARSLIHLSPEEAELTKVFTNVWRSIQFATANQFLMIATDRGLDFYRIYDAITRDYPRMSGLPRGGFAAGPCLFKDTMQLSAANNNNFALGHAAMLINEGLPNFVVRHLKARYDLAKLTVGVLGMAFKGESDDPRESLSYKLRKILDYEAGACLCTDEFIQAPDFLPLADVAERADLLIVAAPHQAYRRLTVPEGKPVIDIWNIFGKGTNLT